MNFRKFLIILSLILLFLFIVFVLVFGYFFIGDTKPAKHITWGVNFSQKHTQNLGLDWQQTYLAILDDLGAKNIKIAVDWDLIEPEEGQYYFDDLDWQIQEAERRAVDVVLVIGIKTSRWPECHIPDWAKELNERIQKKSILKLLEEIVLNYQDSDAVWAWQVENEPFFPFGECPWEDEDFLKREISLVKSLDSKKRPVIVSDSGEWSLWAKAAKAGDIVGVTMYKRVWSGQFGFYIKYPFPEIFYWRKAQLISRVFGKKVICVELQAEPWGPRLLYDLTTEEQEKTMNLEQFRKNIDFARNTGLDKFYLWGAEWWYWLKVKQDDPAIWQEAKKLFI